MEGLEADDTVASCAVQDNSVWPVPLWAGYSQRSFSIQSDVSLIGFPASNVAANDQETDHNRQDEPPVLRLLHANIVLKQVNCCKQAVTLRIFASGHFECYGD